MKTRNKRQQSIKTKLMAAICMLLVSSIMMVSTTYAWFTLSTAPEVTGITTSVGANGSLEMALLPVDGDVSKITSAVGDSFEGSTFAKANVTWGNLVSMVENSGADIYGLDEITLMPSRLNVVAGATDSEADKVVLTSPLKTPVYGSDGRVFSLQENTFANAKEDITKEGFIAGDKFFGVRAVGTASAMSERQLAYRNYRQAAATASSNARTIAAKALSTHGNTLAMIAITHAVGDDKYFAEDVAALKAIATAFDEENGVIDQIEKAIRSYLYAIVASKAAQEAVVDNAYASFISTLEGMTLEEINESEDANIQTFLGKLPTWDAMYAKYVDLTGSIDAAVIALSAELPIAGQADRVVYDEEGNESTETGVDYYTWETISPILKYFADPDAMTVNDMKTSEINSNMQGFIDKTSEYNYTVNLVISSEGGVYADVADFCSDYDTEFKLTRVKAMSMNLKNVPAKMSTDSDVVPSYLDAMSSVAVASGAPTAGTSAGATLTDMYGYIIDLAFRTNASGADLLLQTDGIDRIYANQKDESTGTLGAGSTMSFKGNGTFGNAQVVELMKALNVVFFDKATGEIYGVAKLDTNKLVTDGTNGTEVSAKLYLYEYTINDGVLTVDMNLKQGQNYKQVQATDADGNLLTDDDGNPVMTNSSEVEGTATATLKSLTQNVAATVSVLVYLDGDQVENADVAADVATSMTGSLNLQFATSATLTPMNYTPLKGEEIATYNVTATAAADGATVSTTSATGGEDFSFTLTGAVDGTTYTVAATVGGTAVTVTESNGTYTIAGADVTGDIAITVTAN